MPSSPILITRPESEANALKTQLIGRGLNAIAAPVARIVPLAPALPAWQGQELVATSANAFIAPLPVSYAKATIYAVGEATAQAARHAGLSNISIGPGDAASLADMIIQQHPDRMGSLLYLAGEPRKPVLEERLASAGLAIETLLRYRTEALASLPPAAIQALAHPRPLVLLYSAASAQKFIALCGRASVDLSQLVAICISDAVKSMLGGMMGEYHVAAEPNQESLLRAMDHALEE